jgi:DNA invertase Pin-like site-specific DNA recombinase
MMLERQREGVAKAKREGKYMGPKPTACERSAEVRKLAGEGLGPIEIAKKLGIHRASVWRILSSTPEAEAQMHGRVDAWKARKSKEA